MRHGESVANAGRVHQGPDAPLSALGKQQSLQIAERISTLPLEAIIASPYERTRETAEIIAQKINKPIEWSDLFVERRAPSDLMGKPYDDPLTRIIFGLTRAHADDPAWKYSDEESFLDLKTRSEAALAFLTTRSEEHIVVVTHGLFKRILLGSMLFGGEFNSVQYKQLRSFLYTSNTGITVCDYLLSDEDHPNPRWRLITWNDHAHLDALLQEEA